MIPSPPRRLSAVLLAALLWAGCTGCGSEPSDPPVAADDGPHRGGQVVIALTSDFTGVNSLIAPLSVTTSEIERQLFLPLVHEQPDFKTIEPALAESWEFSDDHRELTFHLRRDVLWSDGTPVTADDVVFTFAAWTDEAVAWESASALGKIDRVEAIDAHTARFYFDQVYATQLLDAATFGVILPKHAWGALPFAEWHENADWFREHLVVDGPFDLVSWTPQQEIVLQRNPLYHADDLPYLDRVVLRVVPDQSSQLTQLLNGQVDFVVQLSPDSLERVETSPDVRLHPYWTRGYIAVGWNTRRPELADARVRRALTRGIDRQALVDSIWGEHARPLAGPIPPDVWLYDETLEPLAYDPDEARRLLAAAGWTDSDGDGVVDRQGQPLRLRLLTNTGNRQREDAAVLIQDQLGRVGVAVTADVLEFNTMIEQALGGDFDGLLFGTTIPTTMDFRFALHSDEIEDGSNLVAYSNPEVDRLLDEIREQPTLEAAQPLFDRLQRIVLEDQPYTFLWQSQRLVGARKRVHGVAPNHLFTLWDLDEWWVDEER